MKDQNYPLAIFMVLLLIIVGVSKCAAQAPDADSLAQAWTVTQLNAATYVNPADSTNYIRIWYNIEGASRVARYYEGNQLAWARTLEAGWIEMTPELLTWYDAWNTDNSFRAAVQALVTDFAVIDR